MQATVQQTCVQKCRQRGGQCQPRVLQRKDQNQVKHHVGRHRLDSDFHRCFGVLPGEIARSQHLDQHECHQSEGVGLQAHGGHQHIPISHLTIVEQCRNQRPGQDKQRHCRRHANQQHQADGPIQRA